MRERIVYVRDSWAVRALASSSFCFLERSFSLRCCSYLMSACRLYSATSSGVMLLRAGLTAR